MEPTPRRARSDEGDTTQLLPSHDTATSRYRRGKFRAVASETRRTRPRPRRGIAISPPELFDDGSDDRSRVVQFVTNSRLPSSTTEPKNTITPDNTVMSNGENETERKNGDSIFQNNKPLQSSDHDEDDELSKGVDYFAKRYASIMPDFGNALPPEDLFRTTATTAGSNRRRRIELRARRVFDSVDSMVLNSHASDKGSSHLSGGGEPLRVMQHAKQQPEQHWNSLLVPNDDVDDSQGRLDVTEEHWKRSKDQHGPAPVNLTYSAGDHDAANSLSSEQKHDKAKLHWEVQQRRGVCGSDESRRTGQGGSWNGQEVLRELQSALYAGLRTSTYILNSCDVITAADARRAALSEVKSCLELLNLVHDSWRITAMQGNAQRRHIA